MRGRGGGERPPRSLFAPLSRSLFFVPALLLLAFLVIVPVVQTAYLGFVSPTGGFVGLQNCRDALGSRETLDLSDDQIPYGTRVNNLLWIAIHLPLSLFTGLFLAVTLQKVRGSSIVKSVIFLGMVTPMIVGGIMLRFLFDERSGIVPRTFGLLGVDSLAIQWLLFPHTLLFGLILGSVWLWTGFSLIVYSAGLTTIPKDYFEAAAIDGASSWQMFRKITWPLLRPMTLVVVTMTVLWELKLFDLVFAATGRGGGVIGAADVLALQMYRYAFVALPARYNHAAVVATLLTFLTLICASFSFRRMILGPARGPGLLQRTHKFLWRVLDGTVVLGLLRKARGFLGRALSPIKSLRLPRIRGRTVLVHVVAWSMGLLWLIPFLGVFMTAVRPQDEVLAGWWNPNPFTITGRNFVVAWGNPDLPMWLGIRNSLLVGIPATLIPMFVASFAAYGFARFRFPMRDYVFLSIGLLMTIPQQMVAVPIFLGMLNLGLLDTFLAVILVHSAWGIPWILLFMRNFFQTLPVEVEEAARVDGASDFKIFYKIVLPMALPALAAGALLHFMWGWYGFFFSQVLLLSPNWYLSTQCVPRLVGQFVRPYDLLSAGAILTMSVPVALYAILQRFYIRR